MSFLAEEMWSLKHRASMHADTVANLILLKQSLAAAKAFELKKSQNAGETLLTEILKSLN